MIRRAFLPALLVAGLGGSAAHGATPGTKTYFVLGQQLVPVQVVALDLSRALRIL